MSALWFLDAMALDGYRVDLSDGIKAWIRLYYEEFSDATSIEPEFLSAWSTLVGGEALFHPLESDLVELVAEVQAEITDETGRTFDPIEGET